MSAILSAFNTAPKQKDWHASIVHICKDDIPLKSTRLDKMRHAIDFEAELKKVNLISHKQLSDVLNVPVWFVQLKLCDLVKRGRAKKVTLKSRAFFSHVDNDNI